ncbi:hypothetical protein [Bradyrhizobium sp. BR 1433]|uniref:hypothetical protein n=1 Tax=Bradyrhizobium sp. BR 1433 TaxID=3447967 RepID=UPI003EE4C7E7
MKGIERQTKGTDGPADAAAAGNGVDPAAHGMAAIDQVRDLLFGGAQRSLETNLSGLREEMQASLKQMQADFTNELTALSARLSDLERDTEQKRLELAEGCRRGDHPARLGHQRIGIRPHGQIAWQLLPARTARSSSSRHCCFSPRRRA